MSDNGNGDKIVINLAELTVGDLEDAEEIVGRSILGELTGNAPTAKTVRALLWVVKRRDDPGLTAEAVRDMRILDVDIIDGSGDPKDDGG